MYLMFTHLGRLGATAKGAVPFDAATVQNNAMILEQLAGLPWQAFGPGTDSGASTRALPAIWTSNAKFVETSRRLQLEAAKLSNAAKTGDLAQVKTAFGGVAQVCKACHDDFRKD
jgi:cytochrome c556